MRRTNLLSYIVLFSQVVIAQHYLPTEEFSDYNGLSNSEITYLYQDKSGFFWIGTKNGLNRYDGYYFNQYRINLNDTTALSGTNIIKIFEDAQNDLWLVSTHGISKYLREKDNFRTFYSYNEIKGEKIPINLKDAAIDWKRNIILLLGDDYLGELHINSGKIINHYLSEYDLNESDRNILSITYNGLYNTFFLYGTQALLRYDADGDSLYSISSDEIRNLINTEEIKGQKNIINGECLIFTRTRLFVFENLFTLREIDIRRFVKNKEITGILQNRPGFIYIVTTSSVIEYSFANDKGIELFTYSLPEQKKIEFTTSYFMEPGIFWIGTRNGLFKFNDHQNFFTEHSTEKYFSESSQLTAMAFDETGKLWLSNDAGELVVLEALTNKENLNILARSKVPQKIVSIEKDETADLLYMQSDNGLSSIKQSNGNIIVKNLITSGEIEAFCRSKDTLWVVNERKLFLVSTNSKFKTLFRSIEDILQGPVLDMFSTPEAIFLLQPNQIIRHNKKDSSNIVLTLSQLNLNILPENLCFLQLNDRELILGTTFGLFVYYLYDFKVLPSYFNIKQLTEPVHAIYQFPDQHLWIASSSKLIKLNKPLNAIRTFGSSEGISLDSYAEGLIDRSLTGIMCIAGKNRFVLFNPDSIPVNRNIPKIEITGIEFYQNGISKTMNVINVDTINIDTKYSHLLFKLAILDFWDSDKNTFQYSLHRKGKPDNWVDLGTKNTFYNPIRLKVGDYILKVRGANNDGIWCKEPRELLIHMMVPWWRTRVAIVSYIGLFFLFFYLIMLYTTYQLRRINREYREKELIARKVEVQKEELTLKNKNITDSINYAKRIQTALMPSLKLFKKFFPDSFILHLPKDIVSGDFYWVNEVNGRIYFAAVDCTGHGVPGAFMSIIGFELFRRITEIEKKSQPAEILKSLNQGFETIFKDIENIILRDGMDVAFCAVDPKLKVLEFAGAFNPLYLVRDNTITEIKGDRFSVGLNQLDLAIPQQPFNDHVVPLKDGDIIYIFTDGYADQFGGPEGKKYKYRRFRHLLLALHQLPMDRQVEFLKRSIMDWKGDLDQVDDILVMGIHISHDK